MRINIHWFGKGDIRLFVSRNGFQLYAHKVKNIREGIETGIRKSVEYSEINSIKSVKTFEAVEEVSEIESRKLSLNERRDEMESAMKRSRNSDLEVFNGFEQNVYFVKNHNQSSEYKVELEMVGKLIAAECECPDFIHRTRICKHIAVTLNEIFNGLVANQTV